MVYMSSWRTRLHCPQLWPREKEVCLRENCFRENRLRESPPSSCRGRLCSTKRTCETFAVKAWKDSSVEAQRSQYSTSTRCQQMPTSSASSSNVEISRLIEERYVSPTWRHVLVGEGLVVIRRSSMHRRHVLGSTSINTSLEKGSANIKAPNTGIVYVPIRARRGLSISSRPSFAACRNALEDDYKVQDTGIAYRPNRATSDR